jgi:hypothetical protein
MEDGGASRRLAFRNKESRNSAALIYKESRISAAFRENGYLKRRVS